VTEHVVHSESAPSERLRRLTFRAWRRGFREADLVLGPFVEQVGPALSDAELTAFEALLDVDDDHRIYAWIIGGAETPAEHETPLMARLRTFMRDHVSAAVAQGAG
jgi:antitoxin CptB